MENDCIYDHGTPRETIIDPVPLCWSGIRSATLTSAISDLDLGELNLTDQHDLRLSARHDNTERGNDNGRQGTAVVSHRCVWLSSTAPITFVLN